MNDYDFSTLNDKEFENLTIDLISRDRGKRFERFKAGRDGGIDGRYYGEDGKEEIIQCKHYLKTGYNGLISSLKKKNNGKNELDKVKILNPKKYIFVTSLPLSVVNKEEIKKLFEPYIKADSDIYGQEDLNDLLKENSDIEENHYKLWISSTTVLQRIFNGAINFRSESLVEDIKDRIKYYVVTNNHYKAIQRIKAEHIIIIAGEPGIGKTTLAENIILKYLAEGFAFYPIQNLINEAENIFEKGKKQIFYFDDFLGSNYLEALENNKDSQIMNFIAAIQRDKKNKKFILTSRTNIFNQSLLLSDTFKNKKIEKNEFLLNISELKETEKSQILYNHIWHSNLEKDYKDELYKYYKVIINHKNFNPRLIEFITDIDKIKSISVMDYWEDVENIFNNPTNVWENTFIKQTDIFGRNIVLLIVFNGNLITEEELRESYYRLNSFHDTKEFNSVVKEVVKYFVQRTMREFGKIEYTLFNPSIADFILNRYKNNKNDIFNIFQALHTINGLKQLKNLLQFGILTRSLYEKILIVSFEKIDKNIIEYTSHYELNYMIQLIFIIKTELSTLNIEKKVIELYQELIHNTIVLKSNFFSIYNEEFIKIFLTIESNRIKINNYNFIFQLIKYANPELIYINNFVQLFNHLNIEDENIFNVLDSLITEYLNEELNNRIYGIDSDNIKFQIYENIDTENIEYKFFEDEENDYKEIEVRIDNKEIQIKVSELLDELIEELVVFKCYIGDLNLGINKSQILEKVDIEDIKLKLVDEIRLSML